MIHRTDEAQCALFEESAREASTPKRRRNTDNPQPSDFGLTAPSQLVKNYVLDTNVLLHDPASLERFKENHLCIPVDVLAECRRNLARVQRHIIDATGSERLVALLDAVCGRGETLRSLAGNDDRKANGYEVELRIALDMAGVAFKMGGKREDAA